MRDGDTNRGKARTSELKQRMPELRERMPDLRERMPDLRERMPDLRERVPEHLRERAEELGARSAEELRQRGNDLRVKGTEIRARGSELARHYASLDVSWARCGYARAARAGILKFLLGPLIDVYVKRRTRGAEVLADVTPPVIFVANHSSHLDTPTILRAIPRAWRTRTAVAAAADYFYKSRWKAGAVALAFNTVPLGRSGGGLDATQHVDRLIEQRWNLLMFPEGTRSRDGSVGTVRSGAAVIAARHGIDIVPIHVSGTHAAMPPGRNWPSRIPGRLVSRRHKVEVCFGEPIRVHSADERREIMDEVRAFWEREKQLAADADAAPQAHDVLLMHQALREHELRAGPERVQRFGTEPALDTDDVEQPAAAP